MSLNKGLRRLKALAESHPQINTAFIGELADVTDNADVVYPVVLIDFVGGSISNVAKTTSYGFRLTLLDKVHQSANAKANEYEVISDMMQIAEDFAAQFSDPTWDGLMDFSGEAQVVILKDQTGDMDAGVQIEATLTSDFDSNRCDDVFPSPIIPIDTMDVINGARMFYVQVTEEANNLVDPRIIGKAILSVFRDGSGKRPKNVPVFDTREIQVVGNQNITDDAVVSTTGEIILTPGDIFYANEVVGILTAG